VNFNISKHISFGNKFDRVEGIFGPFFPPKKMILFVKKTRKEKNPVREGQHVFHNSLPVKEFREHGLGDFAFRTVQDGDVYTRGNFATLPPKMCSYRDR